MKDKVLGLIPARGKSRGIPRKNIQVFLGKPLLAWTVEVSLESGVCERVIVSTDDGDIAGIGRIYGAEVPFLRPAEFATDAASTAAVARHAVDWLSTNQGYLPDYVVVLEPTSPGRQPFHIRESLMLLRNGEADSVASVTQVPHHYVSSKQLVVGPDRLIVGVDGSHPRNMVHRRQDLPTYYAFDGMIFACHTKWILQDPPTLWGNRVLAYTIDYKYSIDLDRPEDWAAAEARLRSFLLVGET